jgi:hypothetical protein
MAFLRTAFVRLNPARRRLRWPMKVAVFLFALLLVTFPRLDLLARNIAHWRNVNALIDSLSPALDSLAAELEPALAARPHGPEALALVEAAVNARIPYAWDWQTWGVADYLPTVEQTMAAGREDCDGRALVAASLLQRFGYDARLKSDLTHVWVWTPDGETMAPRRTAGPAMIGADAHGTRFDLLALIDPRALLIDMPKAAAYGVSVFPVWREVLLLGVFCGLLVRPGFSSSRAIIGALTLLGAGALLRYSGAEFPSAHAAWGGLALGLSGVRSLLSAAARPGPIPPAEPAGTVAAPAETPLCAPSAGQPLAPGA